jgi:hypothetical protein
LKCQVAWHPQTPVAAHALASAPTPGFAATPAAGAPVSYDREAAESFVVDLFRRGRVAVGAAATPESSIEHPKRTKSHEVVNKDGSLELTRLHFDCGFHA